MTGEKKKAWGGPIAALLLALPLFYVLSVGPYWRMQHRNVFKGSDRYMTIYAPIDWICGHSSMSAAVFNSYAGLWMPTESLCPAYHNCEFSYYRNGTLVQLVD